MTETKDEAGRVARADVHATVSLKPTADGLELEAVLRDRLSGDITTYAKRCFTREAVLVHERGGWVSGDRPLALVRNLWTRTVCLGKGLDSGGEPLWGDKPSPAEEVCCDPMRLVAIDADDETGKTLIGAGLLSDPDALARWRKMGGRVEYIESVPFPFSHGIELALEAFGRRCGRCLAGDSPAYCFFDELAECGQGGKVDGYEIEEWKCGDHCLNSGMETERDSAG